jgi:hypothetical protein
MIKKLALPCLLLIGLFAAVAETEKTAPAKKVGWVETVKLDIHGWTVHADTRLVDDGETVAN